MCFRNNEKVHKVLSQWRTESLERCYNLRERNQKTDQNYLESIDNLADQLVISQNPSFDLTQWNSFDGNKTPTTFFHYHSAKYVANGCLAPITDISYSCTLEMIKTYALPYLKALDGALNQLQAVNSHFFPIHNAEEIKPTMCLVINKRHIPILNETYPNILPLEKEYCFCATPQLHDMENICGPLIRKYLMAWSGDYPDWQSAEAVANFCWNEEQLRKESLNVALAVRNGNALWIRDGIPFSNPEYNWPVLSGLLEVALRSNGCLHVLDFGGSLGGVYWQHKPMLENLKECSWHVVDIAENLFDAWQELASETLFFHKTIEEAFAASPINVVLISGVIQYLEFPELLLKQFVAKKLPIIFDRTPMLENGERITVQRVPKCYTPQYDTSASFVAHWLNKQQFVKFFEESGYILSPWFNETGDLHWFNDAGDIVGHQGVIAMPRQ